VSFLFFVCFLSSLVWFFLWLPEEELTLLFLLHCENGDFSIIIKDICELDQNIKEFVKKNFSGMCFLQV
jgi:hypothetical protein